MTALLRVNGSRSVAEAKPVLVFDEFVPLQFRSYREPLGGGYLRLGNYSTTLVELAVEAHSQVLCGVTITSLAFLEQWPLFSVSAMQEGLPVLATEFEDWKVLDLAVDFRAAACPNEIVVYWENLGACEAYAFDRARFLVRNRLLVGVLFVDLSEREMGFFLSHARAPECGSGI